MDEPTTAPSDRPRPKKKRRLLKVFAALISLAIVLAAIMPWLLGFAPGRAWLLGQINASLAPGKVEAEGLSLSWTGPIEVSGLALRDPKGKLVLGAGRVSIDRGLLALIGSRTDLGTITIEGATVDVERRADGSIDLLDALATAMTSGPPAPADAPPQAPQAPAADPAPSGSPLAVSVVIKGGTLRVASPELVEPAAPGSIDGSLAIAPGRPIELASTLTDGEKSLEIRATIDPSPTGDRSLKVVGKAWPIHVRKDGVEARGGLDGTIEAKSAAGSWSIVADPAIVGFEASGPALSGDRLTLDRVAIGCDIAETPTGWAVRKFELASPVASLSASGTIPAADGAPTGLRGRVDLAALAKMLPHALLIREGVTLGRGAVTLRADVTKVDGSDRLALVASVDDFEALENGKSIPLREPIRLSVSATRAGDKLSVERVEVKAAGVDVWAGGDLESGVDLKGTVDLASMMGQVREVLDPGVDLAGSVRLAADYKWSGDSYRARALGEIKGLKVVRPGSDPIVRDVVRLDASAVGPRRPDGSPDGWREGRFDLDAGDLKANLAATNPPGGAATLAASTSFGVDSPLPGRADVRGTFRRSGTVYESDEIRASIVPTDPTMAEGAFQVSAKGRVDLASGAASLTAVEGSGGSAVGVASEGVTIAGLGRPGEPLKVDASLGGDLAALDRLLAAWSGSAPKGWGGGWSGKLLVGRSTAGAIDLDAKVIAAGLASLTLRGGYAPATDRLDLAGLGLSTGYGRLTLEGQLAEATRGRKLLLATGHLDPNWETLDRLVAGSAGPSAKFRGTPRAFRVEGSLLADSTPQLLGQLAGEVGVDLSEAHAYGVTLGQTPVILKFGAGHATFDPVVGTINGGAMMIRGHLAFDADYGLWLKLEPSRIEKAAINQEVSDSLLSFVAPVLAKSSSVAGGVTVVVHQASVPITGAGPIFVDGAIALQDVVFDPGQLGAEVASVAGRPGAKIRIDQAMAVQIHDNRIFQDGLAIGAGNTRVPIGGSVGFDESLDLKATVPLSASMIGLDPKLDRAFHGATVAVPIRGTLAKPAVDRRSLETALRDAAKKIGVKELGGDVGGLLERVAGSKGGDLEDIGREILGGKKP